MKLSSQLISWHLSQKYNIKTSDYMTETPNLKYPLYYKDGISLEGGIVYIVDDPHFLSPVQHRSNTLLLFTGQIFPNFHEEYSNVCILPPNVSSQELMGFVSDIFLLYEDWNQSLTEVRFSNGSIQDLLEATDKIIPNPMAVIDMDFTVLASKFMHFGELKDSVLGTNEETIELVASLHGDPNYAEAVFHNGYFYFPGNDIAIPSLCVNIRDSHRTVCRLIIIEGVIPLDSTFGFILEYIARHIAFSLSINPGDIKGSAHSLNQIFSDILSIPSSDYVENSRQLTVSGWLSHHYYQCILIQAGTTDVGTQSLRPICSYVENSIPFSCAVEYSNKVVVFIDLDLSTLSMDAISQKIATFVRDSLLNAGYSRKLLGHFNFRRMYTQANLALTVGRRNNPYQWIHHFNDIAMNYIMGQITRQLPAYMVAHERLLALKNISDSDNYQLYDTYRCYLENHLNLTKTSNALFIHRSTLLYRLEKINSILKVDVNNPDEMLYMLLSFKLMDMENRD